MIRAAGASAAIAVSGFLVSGLLISFLLALGERDWYACAILAGAPAAPLWDRGALLGVLAQTLSAPFASPAAMLLHFGPVAPFAVFVMRARWRGAVAIQLAGLAGFLALALVWLLPPGSQHACAAAPPRAAALLAPLLALGLLAALLANRIACIAGACRPGAPRTP